MASEQISMEIGEFVGKMTENDYKSNSRLSLNEDWGPVAPALVKLMVYQKWRHFQNMNY